MKARYPYLHVEGADENLLSRNVVFAGLIYLVFAAVSVFFWIRGIVRASGRGFMQLSAQ